MIITYVQFKRLVTRGIALVIIASFLLSESYPAFSVNRLSYAGTPAENPLPAVLPEAFQLPRELGAIQDRSLPKDLERSRGRFIFLVQDAHAQLDAARNIRDIIGRVEAQCGPVTVMLEGGEGELDSLFFRALPHEAIKQKILDGYLERGDLSGGEAASVAGNGRSESRYFGIETQSLYDENKRAFLEAFSREGVILGELEKIEARLDRLSNRMFSGPTRRWLAAWKQFHSPNGDLVAYLNVISSLLPSGREISGRDFSAPLGQGRRNDKYPELAKMTELLRSESLQDQQGNDLLRLRWTEYLNRKIIPRFSKVSQIEAGKLVQAAQTYAMSWGDFVEAMARLARMEKIQARVPVAFKQDRTRAATLSSLEGTRVFDELISLEGELRSSLARNENERRLLTAYRDLERLRRFARLELSNDEWNQVNKADSPLHCDFSAHRRFYELASKRDQALYDNMIRRLGENGAKIAVVLSGGFHSAGLSRRLHDSGIPFAVITPQIRTLEDRTKYLDLMGRNPTFVRRDGGDVWSSLARDYAARVADAVRKTNDWQLLKAWRDGILREAIRQEKIAQVGDYTRFIDALQGTGHHSLSGPFDSLRDLLGSAYDRAAANYFEKLRENAAQKFEVFAGGVNAVWKSGDFSAPTIARLVEQVRWAGGSHLAPELRLIRARARRLSPAPMSPSARPRREIRASGGEKIEELFARAQSDRAAAVTVLERLAANVPEGTVVTYQGLADASDGKLSYQQIYRLVHEKWQIPLEAVGMELAARGPKPGKGNVKRTGDRAWDRKWSRALQSRDAAVSLVRALVKKVPQGADPNYKNVAAASDGKLTPKKLYGLMNTKWKIPVAEVGMKLELRGAKPGMANVKVTGDRSWDKKWKRALQDRAAALRLIRSLVRKVPEEKARTYAAVAQASDGKLTPTRLYQLMQRRWDIALSEVGMVSVRHRTLLPEGQKPAALPQLPPGRQTTRLKIRRQDARSFINALLEEADFPERGVFAYSEPFRQSGHESNIRAHVLPGSRRFQKRQFGYNVTVTGLLEGLPEIENLESPLPHLLLHYLRDRLGRMLIRIYALPEEKPREELPEDPDRFFEQLGPEERERRLLGEIEVRRSHERRPEISLKVRKGPMEIFLSESMAMAQAPEPKEPFSGQVVFERTHGWQKNLLTALKIFGIERVSAMPKAMAKAEPVEAWPLMVMERSLRKDPYGHEHALLLVSFAKGRAPTGGLLDQSPLQFVIILRSNHPQWGGAPHAYLPTLGLWAAGVIEPQEVMASETRSKVYVTGNPKKWDVPTRPPYAYIIHTPVKGYAWSSNLGKMKGFRLPRFEPKAHVLGYLNREPEKERPWRWEWPLVLKEGVQIGRNDRQDVKFVGVIPDTGEPLAPVLWIPVSRGNRILAREQLGRPLANLPWKQIRRIRRAVESYLSGKSSSPKKIWAKAHIQKNGLRKGGWAVRVSTAKLKSGRVVAQGAGAVVPADAILPPEGTRHSILLRPPDETIPLHRPYLRGFDLDLGLAVYFYNDAEGRRVLRANELPSDDVADRATLRRDFMEDLGRKGIAALDPRALALWEKVTDAASRRSESREEYPSAAIPGVEPALVVNVLIPFALRKTESADNDLRLAAAHLRTAMAMAKADLKRVGIEDKRKVEIRVEFTSEDLEPGSSADLETAAVTRRIRQGGVDLLLLSDAFLQKLPEGANQRLKEEITRVNPGGISLQSSAPLHHLKIRLREAMADFLLHKRRLGGLGIDPVPSRFLPNDRAVLFEDYEAGETIREIVTDFPHEIREMTVVGGDYSPSYDYAAGTAYETNFRKKLLSDLEQRGMRVADDEAGRILRGEADAEGRMVFDAVIDFDHPRRGQKVRVVILARNLFETDFAISRKTDLLFLQKYALVVVRQPKRGPAFTEYIPSTKEGLGRAFYRTALGALRPGGLLYIRGGQVPPQASLDWYLAVKIEDSRAPSHPERRPSPRLLETVERQVPNRDYVLYKVAPKDVAPKVRTLADELKALRLDPLVSREADFSRFFPMNILAEYDILMASEESGFYRISLVNPRLPARGIKILFSEDLSKWKELQRLTPPTEPVADLSHPGSSWEEGFERTVVNSSRPDEPLFRVTYGSQGITVSREALDEVTEGQPRNILYLRAIPRDRQYGPGAGRVILEQLKHESARKKRSEVRSVAQPKDDGIREWNRRKLLEWGVTVQAEGSQDWVSTVDLEGLSGVFEGLRGIEYESPLLGMWDMRQRRAVLQMPPTVRLRSPNSMGGENNTGVYLSFIEQQPWPVVHKWFQEPVSQEMTRRQSLELYVAQILDAAGLLRFHGMTLQDPGNLQSPMTGYTVQAASGIWSDQYDLAELAREAYGPDPNRDARILAEKEAIIERLLRFGLSHSYRLNFLVNRQGVLGLIDAGSVDPVGYRYRKLLDYSLEVKATALLRKGRLALPDQVFANPDEDPQDFRSEMRSSGRDIQAEINRASFLMSHARARAAEMLLYRDEFMANRRFRQTLLARAAAEPQETLAASLRQEAAGIFDALIDDLRTYAGRLRPETENTMPGFERAMYAASEQMAVRADWDLTRTAKALKERSGIIHREAQQAESEYTSVKAAKDEEALPAAQQRIYSRVKARLKTQLLQAVAHLRMNSPNESAVMAVLTSLHESYLRLAGRYAVRWKEALARAGTEKLWVLGAHDREARIYNYSIFRVFANPDAQLNQRLVIKMHSWKRSELGGGTFTYVPELTDFHLEDLDKASRQQLHIMFGEEDENGQIRGGQVQDYEQVLARISVMQHIRQIYQLGIEQYQGQLPKPLGDEVTELSAWIQTGIPGGLARGRVPEKRAARTALQSAILQYEAGNHKEAFGFLDSAMGHLKGRLSDIEHKKAGVQNRFDYFVHRIRKQETWLAMEEIVKLLELKQYQAGEDLLKIVVNTHYRGVANQEDQYRSLKIHMTWLKMAFERLAGLQKKIDGLPVGDPAKIRPALEMQMQGILHDQVAVYLQRIKVMSKAPKPRAEMRTDARFGLPALSFAVLAVAGAAVAVTGVLSAELGFALFIAGAAGLLYTLLNKMSSEISRVRDFLGGGPAPGFGMGGLGGRPPEAMAGGWWPKDWKKLVPVPVAGGRAEARAALPIEEASQAIRRAIEQVDATLSSGEVDHNKQTILEALDRALRLLPNMERASLELQSALRNYPESSFSYLNDARNAIKGARQIVSSVLPKKEKRRGRPPRAELREAERMARRLMRDHPAGKTPEEVLKSVKAALDRWIEARGVSVTERREAVLDALEALPLDAGDSDVFAAVNAAGTDGAALPVSLAKGFASQAAAILHSESVNFTEDNSSEARDMAQAVEAVRQPVRIREDLGALEEIKDLRVRDQQIYALVDAARTLVILNPAFYIEFLCSTDDGMREIRTALMREINRKDPNRTKILERVKVRHKGRTGPAAEGPAIPTILITPELAEADAETETPMDSVKTADEETIRHNDPSRPGTLAELLALAAAHFGEALTQKTLDALAQSEDRVLRLRSLADFGAASILLQLMKSRIVELSA
ncbi:MAG: hypothetical protein WC352_02180 [Candidatus Omnitrophota bacterium]|jgi:hypothetical protein